MTIAIIIGVIVIGLIIWKSRPIKNSHKLPQSVEIMEYNNSENKPENAALQKGHKLTLSRELGNPGYNLYLTLETNGKDLTNLKKIIISWSEWKEMIFDFKYSTSGDNVKIEGDIIRIDIGSFNNCPGSKNFLKRTTFSEIMRIDLLDFEPERDYEYGSDIEAQSVFIPFLAREELKKFKKGLHYIDS